MSDKYMKKYSASLATKEMQIKTTLRFHLTPVRKQTTNAGEDVGKRKPYTFLVGMQISVTTMEISMEVTKNK
jgi:hypothetical protein